MKLLLLSGRPGAGKTAFAKWLKEQRGFQRVETDEEAVWAEWGPLLCNSHRPGVAAATRAKAEALGEQVVIEWGFVADLYLGCVRHLRDAGFDAWWLDCDEAVGRERYEAARREKLSPWELKNAVNNYRIQTDKIEAVWPGLKSFYGESHIIRTDTSEGGYRPFEEIASIMLPGTLRPLGNL